MTLKQNDLLIIRDNKPFQPFRVNLVGGKSLLVERADSFMAAREQLVIEITNQGLNFLPYEMIVSIEFIPQKTVPTVPA